MAPQLASVSVARVAFVVFRVVLAERDGHGPGQLPQPTRQERAEVRVGGQRGQFEGESVDRHEQTGLLRERLPLSLIHISEPTRLLSISYAVFCLKKKNTTHAKKHTMSK